MKRLSLFSHIFFYGSVCLVGAGIFLTGNVPEEKLIQDLQAQSPKYPVDLQKKKEIVGLITAMKDPNAKSADLDKLLSKGKE